MKAWAVILLIAILVGVIAAKVHLDTPAEAEPVHVPVNVTRVDTNTELERRLDRLEHLQRICADHYSDSETRIRLGQPLMGRPPLGC